MSKSTKIRVKSKTREWEKERRNRLNEHFNKLWEVLPVYDSSRPLSKPDILIHARSAIKELDEKLQNLLVNPGTENLSEGKLKVSGDVIKKLQDRIRKLLLRNEQLANLLRNAGLKVSSECGSVKKFRKTFKYAKAITTEQQANILQKELEKENQVKGSKPRLSKSTGKSKVFKQKKTRKSKKSLVSSPNCLFVVSQPTLPNNSCFIISKTSAKCDQTVMTNSLLVKAPIVSSDIKPSIFPTYPQPSGLGPGTLVFADGTMMPIVPSPRSIPVLPTIFTNPVPNQLSTLIVMSSKSKTNSSSVNRISTDAKMSLKGNSLNLDSLQTLSSPLTKGSVTSINSLPVLRPRSNITKTTQVNKVPIPALLSKDNKHTCLDGIKSLTNDQRTKELNTPVGECLTKKRTSKPVRKDTKKFKISPNEIAKNDKASSLHVNKNAAASIGVVETPNLQSNEESAALNTNTDKISEDKTLRQVCNKMINETNPQATLNKNVSSAVSQSMIKVSESHANSAARVPTIDSFPIQPFIDNENEKVIKTHEIKSTSDGPMVKNVTVSTTSVPSGTHVVETKQANLSAKINKESFESSNILPSRKLLSATCSNNYELETFENITSRSEPIKDICLSTARNIPITVSKHPDVNSLHSERCVVSCVNSQTNDSLKVNMVTSRSLTRHTDSINAKPLEMHSQHKSYDAASTCLKQGAKPFELTNLQTGVISQNSNINDLKSLELNLPQAELSNDIFASFQVPPGCQNPESTSPTAAFLLAFPLVSSGAKVAEVMGDENLESQTGTPNLLQIGTMDISKPTQSYSESLTPNLLNFDNFSFFNNRDNGGGFYNNCSMINVTTQASILNVATSSSKTITSFTNNTAVHHLNTLDNVIKNDHSKSSSELKFPTNVHYNKSEIASSKPSNQNNKMDINAKDSSHGKFSNYHGNGRPCPTQVTKEPPSNNLAHNIEKSVTTSIMQVNTNNTNVLDINSEMFSFKPTLNENYLNINKHSNIVNVPGTMYTSKSSANVPNYSNYKNCNSSVSNQFVASKHYPPVYTSAGNTFYNSYGADGETRNFNTSNCNNNYTDYNRKSFANSCSASSQIYQKDKNHNMQPKVKPASQNKPINWMTTPSTTTSYKPDYFLPPFSKDSSFNSNLATNTTFSTLPSNTYFNSSVYNPNDHLNITQDFRKTSDMHLPAYGSYQRTETEENQFSWSPNKMPQFLDTTHAHSFVSSTLPTLVGDLALNTPSIDQKNLKERNRDNRRKAGNCDNQSGQTNFLSVSQLVEQSQENVPAKVASRRSSGNRSKVNSAKTKRTSGRSEPNKEMQSYQKNDKSTFNISIATNLFNESKQPSRNNAKHIPSSYSAEALIGNQGSSESSSKRNNSCQNKPIIPTFFNENIVSYFPSVEVSQDNTYMHPNQSYQSNSFTQNFTTTFQNNSYSTNNFIPSSCTITSAYMPNNNFMPNSNTQDFLGDNTNLFQNSNTAVAKEKCNFAKNYYRCSDKEDKTQGYSCKKAKKRTINESVLPSFDIHFFSMPGAINSPILPDDFHTTYLPPTTLYSCKNPLYPKPNTEGIPGSLIPPLPAISGNKPVIQHPQMSPSVNSAGTSLTNFNLSAIFPEINKGPVQEAFSDNRNKDFTSVTKSFSTASSHQVPFSNKSSIIF